LSYPHGLAERHAARLAEARTRAVLQGTQAVSLLTSGMIVLFSTGGYVLSRLSYRGAGLAAPLATVSVTNPVVAAIAGVLVFGEGVRFGRTGLIVAAPV